MQKKPRKLVLRIDKYALDEECAQLPDDYEHWGKLAAAAKNRVATAKAEMELVEAELQLSIRRNPDRYGFGSKPSEKVVAMKVLTESSYQAALAEYIDAKHEQDQYDVAVSGLGHKRPLIESLAFLHTQSYFSKPSQRPRGVKKRGRGGESY